MSVLRKWVALTWNPAADPLVEHKLMARDRSLVIVQALELGGAGSELVKAFQVDEWSDTVL